MNPIFFWFWCAIDNWLSRFTRTNCTIWVILHWLLCAMCLTAAWYCFMLGVVVIYESVAVGGTVQAWTDRTKRSWLSIDIAGGTSRDGLWQYAAPRPPTVGQIPGIRGTIPGATMSIVYIIITCIRTYGVGIVARPRSNTGRWTFSDRPTDSFDAKIWCDVRCACADVIPMSLSLSLQRAGLRSADSANYACAMKAERNKCVKTKH